MRYEYDVERISCDLEKYLNEKKRHGWNCVSVTNATGLGWTRTVVLKKSVTECEIDSGTDTSHTDVCEGEVPDNGTDTSYTDVCEREVSEKTAGVQPADNNGEAGKCDENREPQNDAGSGENNFKWNVEAALALFIIAILLFPLITTFCPYCGSLFK